MNKNLLFSSLIFIGIVSLYSLYGFSDQFIFLNVRLPRLLLTIMVGMILSGVGSNFQILLNNPLAEPYILGVSSGAALAGIIAGLLGMSFLAPLFGFTGAIVSILIVWSLSRIGGHIDKVKLLFSGFIYGMFTSSIISFLMYINQKDVGTILPVLMGNLAHIFTHAEWIAFLISFCLAIIALIYLSFQSGALNIMASSEDAAQSLGVDVKKLRRNIFIIGSLLTGLAVAYAGIIGFIGLIIPHFVRMIVGADQKKVYPYSLFYGASFLLICDLLASHITVIELPVGIITSFIGCPVFLYLLLLKKK
jgi:iron complex transport system permease protein